MMSSWRSSVQLRPVEDFFNDKINYSCTTFDDVVRLNEEMHKVCQKYKLFGATEDALRVISDFQSNLEIIQQMLGEIETLLQPATSRLAEISSQVNVANEAMLQTKHKIEAHNGQLPQGILQPHSKLTWDPQLNRGLVIEGPTLSLGIFNLTST